MLDYIESFIIFVLLYFIIFQKHLKKKKREYVIKFSLMYVYIFLVLCVTILPIDFTLDLKWNYHSSIDFTYIHLRPFDDLKHGYLGAKKQIILNIIMTMPFGVLYPSLKRESNIIKTVTATFLLSLTIEIIQLIMTVFLLHYRSCDVTDLITNTIGGLLGFILYKLIKKKVKIVI